MRHEEHRAFDEFVTDHPVGTAIRGRVTNVQPFGAFCQLAEGVEGLLEVIHFDGRPRTMKFPDDYPRVGDLIDVTIAFINRKAHQIRLTQRPF